MIKTLLHWNYYLKKITFLKMKKYLIFIILTFFMNNVEASGNTDNSIGNFKRLEKFKHTFIFYTTNGIARVEVWSAVVFRITVCKNNFERTNPYSIVSTPVKTKIRFENVESYFLIKTDSLTLHIDKFPLRFTFKTPVGKVINTDDVLGTYWENGKVYAFKKLYADEKFIGLGEKTGHFNRRGSAFTNWNTDNPHYMNWDDPLYSSIPFYIGIHDNLKYGIFLDNTTKTFFNFGAGNTRFTYFSAEDNQLDYYFIYHKNVTDILEEYATLSGKIEMPPLWSLGFQQCRWSYTPYTEVMDIADRFHHHKIPLDVLYLDIDYMDNYKVFTWNPDSFPNPKKLTGYLKKLGMHTMVIIDPGIKVENGYHVFDEGVKNNYFLKYPNGTNYEGEVWPGLCNFPDFTNPDVRTWWGKQFLEMIDKGATGFWNDMNEIAVWGKDVPPIIKMNGEGKEVTYAQMKNVYGMQMARATYEGTKKLMKGKRPLILTRSGFAGFQRYSAIWTGDNHATDEHMLLGIRMVNSLGISGVPFAGYDVGGFNGDATKALYARWISLGTFSPFFRAHSAIGTKRAEPWSFGENTERIAKRFIRLRYNMLPYIYSLFYEASQTGMPVQRSLALIYPDDPRSFYYTYENQYLFGPSFLIAPSESKQKAVKVFLPQGQWYYFYNCKKFEGNTEILVECPLNKPAVFIKESAIIPIQKQMLNTSENSGDTLEIHIYKGNVNNTFIYYEDDGISYKYKKGDWYRRIISFYPSGKKIIFDKPQGNYHTHFKTIRLQLHGFKDDLSKMKLNGKTILLRQSNHNYLYRYQVSEKNISSINIPVSYNKVTLTW